MLKKIFKLSYLFILIGFICTAFFILFSFRFMETVNPSELEIQPVISVIVFAIGLTSWALYIYFEFKAGNKPKWWITVVCAFLLAFTFLGVIIQRDPFTFTTSVGSHGLPSDYSEYYTVYGDFVSISLPISIGHRIFFIFAIILIVIFMYAGFFIFSKRIKSLWVIRILGYIIFVFVTTLCVYSYIKEGTIYANFVEKIFVEGQGAPGVQSYILNPNAFAMSLLLGIIFCCINHSIERKWFYFPIMLIMLIQMFFTYSRTSLAISIVLGPAYIIYCLITTFRGHFKRNLILSISFGVTLLTLILFFIISIATDGAFIPYFNNAIKAFSSTGSLISRFHIWEVTFEMMNSNPIYYIFGMGYGLINFDLFHVMLIKEGWDIIPTHNSFVHLLAQGGILTLLLYVVFMVYVVILIVKNWKRNHALFYAVSLALLAFTFYSFIETIQYLVYPFILVLFMIINIYQNKELKQTK